MNSRQFASVAGTVFAIVGALHLLRVVMGWPLVIGTWEAPVWLSIAAFLLAGCLAWSAWRVTRE